MIADLPEPAEAAELRPTFKAGVDFKTLGTRLLEDLNAAAQRDLHVSLAPDNCEGVRMNFDSETGNGWALVRMSLHEPILPVNAESEEKGGVRKILAWLYGFLKNYPFLNLQVFQQYSE